MEENTAKRIASALERIAQQLENKDGYKKAGKDPFEKIANNLNSISETLNHIKLNK